ncbi:IclR family transcriptional regulator [Enterovirga rhinocerotis]|uniref:IclR family transcriptional regulator n=1 Tax=Enterovirga rhinocerotis TaxID=1339210 RepID=A0A4R7C9C1_9HYPH|nr:IclR family transcriptional regulator [Enterovirga rhinocerotis]TDR93506.1 IclR family transcriptional regulator [Enterovirga rhinocerotis]
MKSGLGAGGAQTIQRAVSLLREVSASRGRGARLTALAEAAELPVPTAHRLLAALTREGLLERDAATRGYRLGSLLYEFGLAASPDVDIRRLCASALQRLASETGDCAYVNARSGRDALCLDRREGSFAVQAAPVRIGNRRPLGVGSGALALLAILPSEEVDAVLESNARRYRRHGMSVDRVRVAVEATRARGFAVTTGRIVARFRGVALAVGNGVNGVPVALSVIAADERLDAPRIDRVVALLRREESALRAALTSELFSPAKGTLP